MQNASMIAVSALMARQRELEVSASNIANSSTLGYKAERVLFSDWLSRQQNVDSPPGGRVLDYNQDRATWREQQDGSLTKTGNPLDIAITGQGYFQVDTPNGPRLTRSGRFGLMPDGTIADDQGDALLNNSGRPLQIATTDTQITISGDGTLSTESGQVGKIGLVTPDDANRMTAEGNSLFNADATTTTPVTTPKLVQGAVEDSNVQPVMEITRMMTTQRTFEFISQFVSAESERQQNAIDKMLQKRS